MCKIVLIGFVAFYVLALALLVIGTFGLFGNEKDPLSGVFLMPVGLPWNRIGTSFAPEGLLPWIAALAPLINVGLLFSLCRWRSQRA